MRAEVEREHQLFLATAPAGRAERRLALAVIAVSFIVFAITAPFARVQLAEAWAFIPTYQAALVINDVITAVLLYTQFQIVRSRALLLITSGYLFTAMMAVVHALSFPGLFAPGGLLGAGPQTTAWLYMFWHGGFPLLVIAYSLLGDRTGSGTDRVRGSGTVAVSLSVLAVVVLVACLTLIATAGKELLPAIMSGRNYTPAMIGVVSTVWILSLVALLVLWIRRPHSVLDVWLMVVMSAWLFDVALSAVLNAGRFDLGFYAGRAYGLLAASFVLVVLLLDTGTLYVELARLFDAERRRARAEISSINAKLETLLDSSPLPIFSLGSDGRIATWNAAAQRIFGYAAAAVTGRSFSTLPEIAHSDWERQQQRVMAGAQLQDLRMPWVQSDGRVLDVLYSCAPVRDVDLRITGAVYVAEDVTEKVKLEHQLAQSQKMEAIGQLTGGIAHDFNNILTVITGTIDILAEEVADKPKLAAIAAMIDKAAQRGAELTQHLLAFARKQALQPRDTDINALIVDTAKLLRPSLGEHVEIESMLEDDAWPALVDPSQLTAALLNLAVNARDAMPAGGKLTLETANVYLDESYAKAHVEVQPGPYVMIAVSDTGSGIPVAIRDKVFEPFFTTKDVGKGTGLGLSMVYGFVKQSSGHIKIYSEEGHGTSIKIYLPRSTIEEATTADQARIAPMEHGSERILVVEDDPLVRAYVTAQLESLGYSALAAANAAQALAALDDGATCDLLFTDVIMPGGMNGRELAGEVTRRHPDVKVLFTSGYTESAIIHHGRLDPGVILLPKPYRKSDLARMIRHALDRTRAVETV